jgi:hypothetical protein
VQLEEKVVARQRPDKHVSPATYTLATIEEIAGKDVFSVVRAEVI